MKNLISKLRRHQSVCRIWPTNFAHCASATSIRARGHLAKREEAGSHDTLAADQVAAEVKAVALTVDAAQA